MATAVAEPQQRPTGTHDDWDEATIALLALIGTRDLIDADRMWNRLAPARFADLISRDSRFTFDAETQLYVTPSGQRIELQTILIALYAAIASARRRARTLATRMLGGQDDLDVWQQAFADFLKPYAIALFALGRGGIARVTKTDVEAISQTLEFQYGKLRDFASAVEDGFSPKRAVVRAEQYPISTALLFHQARGESHDQDGFTEERRRLSPAEHCQSTTTQPGCPELAAQGWQPLGTLPDIGTETPCAWNCKCFFDYR